MGQGLWLTQRVPRKLLGWAQRFSLLILTLSSVCWAPDDPQGTSEHLQQGLTGVKLVGGVEKGPACINTTYRFSGPWHFQAGAPQNCHLPSCVPRPCYPESSLPWCGLWEVLSVPRGKQ